MPAIRIDDPILKRFRAELDALYGERIERVVLFGSRARGDARDDSDYDVAVFLHVDEQGVPITVEFWDAVNDDVALATSRRLAAGVFA